MAPPYRPYGGLAKSPFPLLYPLKPPAVTKKSVVRRQPFVSPYGPNIVQQPPIGGLANSPIPLLFPPGGRAQTGDDRVSGFGTRFAVDTNPWGQSLTSPGGTVLTGPQAGMTKQQIIGMQRTLANHGYAVRVDGILGAQTKSALADFHKGVGIRDPQRWSQYGAFSEHPKIHDPVLGNSPTTPNNQNAQPGRNKVTTDKGSQTDAALASGLKGLDGLLTANSDSGFYGRLEGMLPQNQVDPTSYTNALMEAKYGPILAELHRQADQTGSQNLQNEHDVQNWYNQLTGNMATRAGEDRTADQRMIAATDSLGGVAAALGLDAGSAGAATIAQNNDIQSDTARMLTASLEGNDRSLQSIASLQGATDLRNTQAKDRAALAGINADITDTLSQRGNDYTTAFADARQRNADNKMNYINAMSTLHQAGAGEQHQAFADRLAGINTNLALALAPIQAQTALAQLQGIKANNAYLDARTLKTLQNPNGGITPFAKLTGQVRSGLGSQIYEAINSSSSGVFSLDPKTQRSTLTDPERAVKLVRSMLNQAGYDPSTQPKVKDFAFAILRRAGINPQPSWYPKGGKSKPKAKSTLVF